MTKITFLALVSIILAMGLSAQAEAVSRPVGLHASSHKVGDLAKHHKKSKHHKKHHQTKA